ncbi:hypothetical protein BD413DRAFT_232168 [Trametes elegans]|nr:hypothetical protein BD413DRAFT_232168 [Trametes elegans]
MQATTSDLATLRIRSSKSRVDTRAVQRQLFDWRDKTRTLTCQARATCNDRLSTAQGSSAKHTRGFSIAHVGRHKLPGTISLVCAAPKVKFQWSYLSCQREHVF